MLRLIREFFAVDLELRKSRERLASAVEEHSAGTRRIVGRARKRDDERERALEALARRKRAAGVIQ